MAIQQDILLDDDFDLMFSNGDFAIGEADFIHIQLILQSAKGWWKQNPYLGASLPSQIKGFVGNKFLQKARLNLEADDFKVKSIKFGANGLEVEAKK